MKLNRRKFIAGSAGMIASAAVITRAHAAEFEYKFGNSTPASHPFNVRMMEMSKRVLEETDGKLNITIFPNSQLGGDNDLLSQVRTGAVEFAQPAGLIFASILPLTSINGMGFAWSGYDKIWPAIPPRKRRRNACRIWRCASTAGSLACAPCCTDVPAPGWKASTCTARSGAENPC